MLVYAQVKVKSGKNEAEILDVIGGHRTFQRGMDIQAPALSILASNVDEELDRSRLGVCNSCHRLVLVHQGLPLNSSVALTS